MLGLAIQKQHILCERKSVKRLYEVLKTYQVYFTQVINYSDAVIGLGWLSRLRSGNWTGVCVPTWVPLLKPCLFIPFHRVFQWHRRALQTLPVYLNIPYLTLIKSISIQSWWVWNMFNPVLKYSRCKNCLAFRCLFRNIRVDSGIINGFNERGSV